MSPTVDGMRARGGREAGRTTRPRRLAGILAALATLAGVALVGASGSAAAPAIVAETCAVSGPVTESGSVLISHPMVPEITGADLPVTVTTDYTLAPGTNYVQVKTTVTNLSGGIAAIHSGWKL